MAERLAESLGGELEQQPQTVRIGGLRGRQYEIGYEREGVELRQRLTLLLSRRTEYQLLCRWEAGSTLRRPARVSRRASRSPDSGGCRLRRSACGGRRR